MSNEPGAVSMPVVRIKAIQSLRMHVQRRNGRRRSNRMALHHVLHDMGDNQSRQANQVPSDRS